MQALVNAGGKGTRMGATGIEKPMQLVGGKPVVRRVVEALLGSDRIGRILVSVSKNTPETERFVRSLGVDVIRTSGEDFMKDMHEAFGAMDGRYVFTTPSDIPLLTSGVVDAVCDYFRPEM